MLLCFHADLQQDIACHIILNVVYYILMIRKENRYDTVIGMEFFELILLLFSSLPAPSICQMLTTTPRYSMTNLYTLT